MAQNPMFEVALDAFKGSECQDRRKLADFLMGGQKFPKSTITKVEKAYEVIAEHLLESMLRDGILCRDSQGWYRLAIASQ